MRPASGLERAVSSRCRRGRGNSVEAWSLGSRRSQYGTEHGLAAGGWLEAAARLNTAVSGISKAWEGKTSRGSVGCEREDRYR